MAGLLRAHAVGGGCPEERRNGWRVSPETEKTGLELASGSPCLGGSGREVGAVWCQGFTQHLGSAQLCSQVIWAQPGLGLNLSFPDM